MALIEGEVTLVADGLGSVVDSTLEQEVCVLFVLGRCAEGNKEKEKARKSRSRARFFLNL